MIYIIAHRGMGNFLCPPEHAEHRYSVREYHRGREQGSTALTYALSCSWIPEHIKTSVRELLAKFPGKFTPEWESEVYAYFRHCYSPDGIERSLAKMVVDPSNAIPERHLGYLHIREFFPDYTPNVALISNPPCWGKEVTA